MSNYTKPIIIQGKSLGLQLWEDAFEQGFKQGIEQGSAKRIEQAIEQERFNMILALIDYGMSFDEIASIFKLTKEEYQYYQNKLFNNK